MPKLFALRWPIGVFVVLLLIAGVISLSSQLFSATGRAAGDKAKLDGYPGERQELLFLKAALSRIDDEMRHRGAAATPSLRGEREAVLRRVRDVAIRVPADRLPADLAVALQQPAPATAAAPAERPVPPASKIEIGELRTGLGGKEAAIDFSNLALDPLPPLPVFVERPTRGAEHPPDAEATGDKAERPTKKRAAKQKERAAAERAKEHPAADRAAKDHAAAAAANRPAITVERTAVADQSERRQPAR